MIVRLPRYGRSLSIATGLTTLLQVSGKVIRYISEIKDASENRRQLLVEISSARGLLHVLQEIFRDDAEEYSARHRNTMLNTLLSPEGPVDQLTRILMSLEAKLAKSTGWKEKRGLLIWPFEKSDVQSILSVIERQKSLVVLALQGDNLEFNKVVSRELHGISTEVEAATELIRNYGQENSYSTDLLRDQQEQKILEWLSETDFFMQKNDMMNKIQKGTGKWLLESRAFQNWLTGQSSRMLWCHGIPGAGKTYLASSIIDHLEQSFSGQEMGISYL